MPQPPQRCPNGRRWDDTISAAPLVEPRALAPAGSRLLVISVHPDDETVGAGRLVAAWARAVGRVDGLLLTSRGACGLGAEPPRGHSRERVRDWRSAVRDLGARPLGCVDLPDDRLLGHLDVVEDVVATLAVAHDAIAAPWWGDPHPDHVAAGRAVTAAAAAVGVPVIFYPVWMTYWFPPEAVRTPLARLATAIEDESTRALAMARYAGSQAVARCGQARHLIDHHTEQLLLGVA